jgi:hypothetical protein
VAKSKKAENPDLIKVNEPPKIPTLNFGGRPSIFSPGGSQSPKGQIALPQIRITQNKGGGGK